MMRRVFRRLAFTTLAGIMTVSCGGDGGGSGELASGGIGGTGISSGAITGFGSIFVNGVEFDTSGASITLGGISVSESDLKLGMVVEVQGMISGASGTAITVAAEDVVKGPVDSVAADGLSLVALGQTILVDNTTIIDNNIPGQDIRNLNPGVDLIEVHGLVKDNGVIGATRIELKGPLVEFRIKGFVENTDTGAQTFTIGALTVDYSAADTGDLAGGNPVNEQLVEVKGQNTLGSGGELLATKVEPEGLAVAVADRAEVEGFVTITTATPAFDFVVGNQPVLTTGSTIFAGGLQSEIVVGLKVEVEGTLAGGILTATKVSFRDNVKLKSDVETVDASTGTLTLKGLPGITVTVDSQTEFRNVSGLGGPGGIVPTDHVRVRGRVAGTSTVIASELQLRSPDTDVDLQGPVETFSLPPSDSVTILGVAVDTTGIANNNFEGLDGMSIGRTAFFAAVAAAPPARLVKAKGSLGVGGTVAWDEIELED
ncbi:MAG: DUF5666 domain-containing protein [Acidiferrobacterales bacterium]